MLDVKLKDKGTEGELFLSGRLDSVTSPDMERVLLQMAEKYTRLVLNFTQLAYISSAGLRVMKKGHLAMKKKGGEMVITGVNAMIMEVFEMTGFAGFLSFA